MEIVHSLTKLTDERQLPRAGLVSPDVAPCVGGERLVPVNHTVLFYPIWLKAIPVSVQELGPCTQDTETGKYFKRTVKTDTISLDTEKGQYFRRV